MNKKNIRIAIFIAFFSFLIFAIPSAVPTSANATVRQNSEFKVNATNSNLTFNTSEGMRLVYSVDKLLNGSDTFLTPMNDDMYGSHPAGTINQGDIIGFDFHNWGTNGTGTDFVEGSVAGPSLNESAQLKYEFVDAPYILTQHNGPAFLYFVVPNIFFTFTSNYTSAGFTFSSGPDSYTLEQNLFQVDVDQINVSVTWKVSTGALQQYKFVEWGPNANMTLEFSYLGSTDPGALNPQFSMTSPTIFYEISTLQVGSSNILDFSTFNSTNNHGQIEQGQNAMVSLHTYTDSNGPNYEGEMQSLTGYSEIGNPFGDGGGNDGPPDMVFILPVSSDANWWNSFTLWASPDGIVLNGETATTISYKQTFGDSNNNVSITFDKTTGLLQHYNLQFANAELPDGSTGVLNLELTFLRSYDMDTLNPSWGVSVNDQFKYHIDTLNFNGSDIIYGDSGTFKEGQDMHILFNSFNLTDGPAVSVTMSTVTGMAHNDVNYDIFNGQNDGPLLFLPVLPLSTGGVAYNFFADVFGFIVGATVTNNATTLEIRINNMDAGSEMHINHLYVSWDKSNGLMKTYDFDAVNPADSSQLIKLKLTYVGVSTGTTVYNPSSSATSSSGPTSTISAPGFEATLFLAGLVTIAIINQKRKK